VYHGNWAHPNGILHKSLPLVSVSLCVLLLLLLGKGLVKCIPPFVARQWLSKHVPTATNTRNNRRTVGCVCLWVCLCIPLSLLGNNSVKTFPRQWRIVGGIVFYVVGVISEESRRLVLPRTSCLHLKVLMVIGPPQNQLPDIVSFPVTVVVSEFIYSQDCFIQIIKVIVSYNKHKAILLKNICVIS
jgi:hypothetical protein